MDCLNMEFYKNYIGIDKPLIIELNEQNKLKLNLKIEKVSSYSMELVSLDNLRYYSNIGYSKGLKPHLKLPEDLTDEELIYIAVGDKDKTSLPIDIDRNDEFIAVVIGEDWKFMFIDSQEPSLTQEQFNRGYSLHWHPKAKEYIDNGLAVRIE